MATRKPRKIVLSTELKDDTKAGVESVKQSTSQLTEQWGAAEKAVRSVTRSMTELGISAEDQAAYLDQARAVSERTGASLAQTVRQLSVVTGKARSALRDELRSDLGLVQEEIVEQVDEIEEAIGRMTGASGELARRIGDTLDPALRADAETLSMLRGKVDEVADQLKLLGERGEGMATALVGISDPVRRAQLAQQLFNEELGRGRGALDSISDATAELRVRWAQLGPAGQAALASLAAAAVAAAAAVVALAKKVYELGVESWKAYAEQAADAKRALEDLDRETERAKVTFGGLIDDTLYVTELVDAYGASLAATSKRMAAYRESTDQASEASKAFAAGIVGGGQSWGLIKAMIEAGVEIGKTKEATDDFYDSLAAVDSRHLAVTEGFNSIREAQIRLRESTEQLLPDMRELNIELQTLANNEAFATATQVMKEALAPGRGFGFARSGGGGQKADRYVSGTLTGEAPGEAAGFLGAAGGQDLFVGAGAGAGALAASGVSLAQQQQQQAAAAQKADTDATVARYKAIAEGLKTVTAAQVEQSAALALANSEQVQHAQLMTLASQGLTDFGGAAAAAGEQMAFLVGQMLAGGASAKDFGKGLILGAQSLVDTLVPVAAGIGQLLMATSLGSGIAVLAAIPLLKIASGALAAWGSGSSSRSSAPAANNALQRAADRFEADRARSTERGQIVVNTYIGGRQIGGVVTEIVDSAMRDGRLTAYNDLVRMGVGR